MDSNSCLIQDELLQEAALTEVANLQSLEYMLAREEEIKRRASVSKKAYDGPMLRFFSRGGVNTIELMHGAPVPQEINSVAPKCASLHIKFFCMFIHFLFVLFFSLFCVGDLNFYNCLCL